ncbi:hypothetical protein HYU18_01035 [Candidatus Woesearchaeota archaeon]|nr:hypothetical protein [Candidatus Woesearchaeota archaeon]
MPTIRLPNLEVVYKEMFVMQPLYRMTRQWLMENEYTDNAGDAALESNMEILYWWREGNHINPHEKELRIWWRTKKKGVPGGTFGSGYYTHHIDIDWNVINWIDKEIMVDGQKKKVQSGEIRILIMPHIEVRDMEGTPLIKYFNQWFLTRLIKKNLEENRKVLYQDAYRLQNTIKKYLELKSFLPKEDVFHEKFEFI